MKWWQVVRCSGLSRCLDIYTLLLEHRLSPGCSANPAQFPASVTAMMAQTPGSHHPHGRPGWNSCLAAGQVPAIPAICGENQQIQDQFTDWSIYLYHSGFQINVLLTGFLMGNKLTKKHLSFKAQFRIIGLARPSYSKTTQSLLSYCLRPVTGLACNQREMWTKNESGI